jgi:cysteine synthase B
MTKTMTPPGSLFKHAAIGTRLGDTVGNTPMIELRSVTGDLPEGVRVFAKAEWFNPGGSVKARPAKFILAAAQEQDLLSGKRLLDSTSGNMGIAYATLAAAASIPVTLAIPANASPERLALLRALGAELFLSDPLEGSDGAIELARELASEHPERYFYADQYNNPANPAAHTATTGPEIWQQTEGLITHFVAGLGTSGTLVGTSRYLKSRSPDIKCISFQPDGPFHGLEGMKHMPSAIVPGIYDEQLADRDLAVSTESARAMTLRLAREEGLFAGISAGAATVAALAVAAELEEGIVVAIFPDAGDRYLSDTGLWGAR